MLIALLEVCCECVNRTEMARLGLACRIKMEVILTLSNRITLAGVLPILVAFALAVLVAAIALAPTRPAIRYAKIADTVRTFAGNPQHAP